MAFLWETRFSPCLPLSHHQIWPNTPSHFPPIPITFSSIPIIFFPSDNTQHIFSPIPIISFPQITLPPNTHHICCQIPLTLSLHSFSPLTCRNCFTLLILLSYHDAIKYRNLQMGIFIYPSQTDMKYQDLLNGAINLLSDNWAINSISDNCAINLLSDDEGRRLKSPAARKSRVWSKR